MNYINQNLGGAVSLTVIIMELVIKVQILDKVVCISFRNETIGKGMPSRNPTA